MTFTDKLKKLTREMNRTKLSRRIKLPPNAISDYVNKGYLPRLDTGLRIARVLAVSLDWLADDSKGWADRFSIPQQAMEKSGAGSRREIKGAADMLQGVRLELLHSSARRLLAAQLNENQVTGAGATVAPPDAL
jgi:hypothetical protein